MKRLSYLLTALLLMTVSMNAQHVTEEQALQKAQAFLNQKATKGGRRGAPLKMKQLENAAQNDAFYIFNAEQNGGYVIVSGDERTDEILGYSTEGNIDPQRMPENMKEWLKGYEEQIKAIPANAKPASSNVHMHPAVEPLLKSKWNQHAPYNLQCPEINGQHCITGCVATAMAQIMYYWKWPQDYTLSIPAYHRNGVVGGVFQRFHTDEELPPTTFEWDLMKDSYEWDDTGAEAQAVAKLMRYCGQSVEMIYGLNSSWAHNNAEYLINYFGYDNGAMKVDQYSYGIEEWDELIYGEIEAGRPIWYGGSNVDVGHSFVCDGYDGYGGYHFNWGWGGYYDGYFKLNVHSSDDYLTDQSAIIGIQRPTEDNTNYPYIFKINWGAYLLEWPEWSLWTDSNFRNNSKREGYFDGGYMIEGIGSTEYSTVLLAFSKLLLEEQDTYYDEYWDLSSLNLPDGDYRLRPVMKASSKSRWTKTTDYIDFTVSEGIISSFVRGPVIDLEGVIQPRGNLLTGESQRLDVRITNHGGEYYHTVYLYVSQTEDMGKYKAMNTLAVEEESEETIHFNYSFPGEGLYHIWVATSSSASTYTSTSTILAQTDLYINDPIELDMEPYPYDFDGDGRLFSIIIRNHSNVIYDNEVAIRVFPWEDYGKEDAGQVFKSEKLYIEPGVTMVANIYCSGLSIDNFYSYDLMYCKNPNSDVLFNYYTNYFYLLDFASQGDWIIDGVLYSIVDSKNHYVFANYNYSNESSQLVVPDKVFINPNRSLEIYPIPFSNDRH